MRYKWLIDAGHGGLDASGKYTTDEKIGKLYHHPGFTAYEGVINRNIAHKLYTMLSLKGIDFALVYDEVVDTSLTFRKKLVNNLAMKYNNCILLSIHSNAGGGKGLEFFTSIGQDKSDLLVEPLYKAYRQGLPEFAFRSDISDGDHDKEARFTMLDVSCPAILVENLFFDNYNEALLLTSEIGQHRIAEVLFNWILEIENKKPI